MFLNFSYGVSEEVTSDSHNEVCIITNGHDVTDLVLSPTKSAYARSMSPS